MNRGITLSDAIGITFIVLKLCEVIDWSWWLVLLPLYGPIVLTTLVAVFSKDEEEVEPIKPKKSKFQQRLAEMAEQQKSRNK